MRVFNIVMVLLVCSILSFAQDKEVLERKAKEKNQSRVNVKDSDIQEKIEHGDIVVATEYLEGYYDRLGDAHSYAKPKEAIITHASLDIKVDFEKQVISGSVTYRVKVNEVNQMIFDTKDLDIRNVTLNGAKETEFTVGRRDPIFGSPLTVKLNAEVTSVTIDYATTDQSAALQWLNKEQADSKMPFLYTQGEAILTRSWIPIQDSPGIKITYDASVNVPPGMMAVMSAESVGSSDGSMSFIMEHPIPPYLIALAVGDLEYKKISENCGVYGLPGLIGKQALEFSETPEMIKIAESIAGPYVWGKYDMIVLPRAFPFGGMENPMLTFLTPTIIAGDKSLVSLVAHELAHSWSGNLVTNATWNDFWLNEGITVYLERRIIQKLKGRAEASMHRYNGYNDLMSTFHELGKDSKDTHLKLSLNGRDPDDAMTDVAYEKGALFLEYIESRTSQGKMDEMLLDYFSEYKFQTITTEKFISHLKKHFNRSILSDEVINSWIYAPGLPIGEIGKPKEFQKIDELIVAMIKGGDYRRKSLEVFSVPEWLYFFDELDPSHVSTELRDEIATFKPKHFNNTEVKTKWFIFSIYTGNKSEIAEIDEFLRTVGRRKFLVPIYKALLNSPWNTKSLKNKYLKMSLNYHSITQNTLDALFGVSEKERYSMRHQK